MATQRDCYDMHGVPRAAADEGSGWPGITMFTELTQTANMEPLKQLGAFPAGRM